MKHPWLAALLFCVAFANPPVFAADHLVDGVQRVTLGNGLELLLAPDDEASAVEVAVFYDAGTRDERPGVSGISHLFEHLMFRGSAHYGPGEHARLIQAEGGTWGAFTNADLTCFYQTVPAGSLDLALRLEADRMGSLTLTQEILDSQRAMIRDERRQSIESTPLGRGLQRLYAIAFTEHPYRWPVFGLESDLSRLTLQDCRDYYLARYAPNRALVTIAGRFEPARAIDAARRYLEPVQRAGAAVTPPREPAQKAERRALERGSTLIPIVLVGWRGPGRGDPDLPLLNLLSIILTRGRSARLDETLVKSGRCLFVRGDVEGRRDASLLYCIAGLNSGADSAGVEQDLLAEIERLASRPVPDAELDRAKRIAEASLLFGMQGARGRAQALGAAQALAGDYHDASVQFDRLRHCTTADLQRVASRWLTRSQRNIVWLGPAVGSDTKGGR